MSTPDWHARYSHKLTSGHLRFNLPTVKWHLSSIGKSSRDYLTIGLHRDDTSKTSNRVLAIIAHLTDRGERTIDCGLCGGIRIIGRVSPTRGICETTTTHRFRDLYNLQSLQLIGDGRT
jgi:hypothetical protein